MLLDTHHHLDFLPSPVRGAFVAQVADRGVQVVAQTVRPSGFQAVEAITPLVSLGFHPWYLGDASRVEAELAVFAEAVQRTRLIGEAGIDLSPRRVAEVGQARQVSVLRRLMELVCEVAEARDSVGAVVSIHAVRSAGLVLDVLEDLRAVERGAVPVFHRFSGTSDDLTRLVRLDGLISVSPALLASKRGRAYARQVPADRLLLETDLPERPAREIAAADAGAVARKHADDVCASLDATMRMLVELRGEDVITAVRENQTRLYAL